MEEKETIVIDIQLDAKGVANQLAQVNQQIAAVKAQNAALKKEVKDGTKTWKDVSGQLAVNEQRLKTLTTTQKALTNQFNAQVGTNKRLGDSLKEMGAELTAMKNEYRSLSKEERESAKGQDLLKHIQDLDAEMKAADGTMGDFQRNVGNYPGAMKPVTAQLREMTQELIRLRMEGKANTAEYNDLLQKTGEMKDAMTDAQREVKQMASDTGALNSVLSGAQAAAGGFSAALGVMTLLGSKDSETAKEMAEAQQKLQAAIAVTTGLQAVQNALQKESALMMGVSRLRILAAAAAQKLYAAATRDAEAAQLVFNRVAKSNVYIWLVAAIGSVVGAIAAFTRGSKEQEDQLEKVNFELKKQLDYLNELNEAYRKVTDAAITKAQQHLEYLKAQGAETDKIREAEDELLKATRMSIQAEEQRLGYTEQNYNFLTGKYAVALDEYNARVVRMQQLINKGRADAAAFMQDLLDADKAQLDSMAQQIAMFDDVRQRRHEYQVQYLNVMKQRREEVTKTTNHIKAAAAEVKREAQQLIEILTADEMYDKIEERNRKLAESYTKVAERIGLFREEFDKLDPNKFGDSFVSDENLKDTTTNLELFAEAFNSSAEAVQETSTALQTSFSSLSTIYQQMAKDESKTEEERERAAKKAKAWSKLQIAANAGTAVAKGVASAVDVGFPAAIPAIMTMTAAIISAIAQAKQLAEGFETGGVIGGYHGATMGKDNTVINARGGEMVLNANQQRQLFELANGGGRSGGMYSALADALRSMPAPVLVYSEFQQFTDRVVTLDDSAKLR